MAKDKSEIRWSWLSRQLKTACAMSVAKQVVTKEVEIVSLLVRRATSTFCLNSFQLKTSAGNEPFRLCLSINEKKLILY